MTLSYKYLLTLSYIMSYDLNVPKIQNISQERGMYGEAGKAVPPLAGVHEVASILGWDKRKVSTYKKRGHLPEPIQVLGSGPIWTVNQIEKYKNDLLIKKESQKKQSN